MNIQQRVIGLFVLVLNAACVPEPKKAYSPDEVADITSLEELMRVNAATADPLFGKRDQASFTESEYAAMADAGAMIEASATQTGTQFGGKGNYDDGFVNYAKQLAGQAKALADASGSQDAPAAAKALTEIRNTCKSCHGVYR